jgi:hypothetical protein
MDQLVTAHAILDITMNHPLILVLNVIVIVLHAIMQQIQNVTPVLTVDLVGVLILA